MADLAARLTGLAKTANAQGAIDSAASLFDAAHAIGGRVQARISAANMRLKLQQPEQACSEFDALLLQSPPLDPIAHSMVLRKRGDALAMMVGRLLHHSALTRPLQRRQPASSRDLGRALTLAANIPSQPTRIPLPLR